MLKEITNEVRQTSSWLTYRKTAAQVRAMADCDGAAFAHRVKVALAGSFTLEPLADYLAVEAAADAIFAETYVAPYGQYNQDILNSDSALYAFKPDVTLLAVEAEALSSDPLEAADLLVSLAQKWKENGTGVLLLCTFMAAPDWPLHVLASDRQIRVQNANKHLKKTLADDARVQLFDLDALAAYAGYANALSPEMMAMARVPFSEAFLKLLAQKLCSHIKAVNGWSQKCLVLDCDNTLWGGIIGEDGMGGIALGPDWPGREFVDFQKAILELYEQGVILAINSKNNESDVLDVLRGHRHMVLRQEHFAAMVINWENKTDNIRRIAEQLNIGPDSMVFADDNPVERQLMRQVYPQVKILELPQNTALYARTLRQSSFFSKASLSDEDRQRGQMYAAQRQRQKLQETSVSMDSFLTSLEMVCSIRKARPADVKRAVQLTQRTNQFNLTNRRYTEADIQRMIQSDDWTIYVLGLKDKYGDNGTVGLAIVEKQGPAWRIDTFLMSCRVIGRQAEDALVDTICRDAVCAGAKTLHAHYIPTARNTIASEFWDKRGFTRNGTDDAAVRYVLELADYRPKTFDYLCFEQDPTR